MVRKVPILLGIVCLIGAAVWVAILNPRFNQRFFDGWTWQVRVLGTNAYPDETGEYPANMVFPIDDPINNTIRNVTASTAGLPDGQMRLVDHFASYDVNTNVLTWEANTERLVDPEGRIVEDAQAGNYYLFPRNVQKQTYTLTNATYISIPVEFVDEEIIGGVTTYYFRFNGDLPNRLAYPAEVLEADQDIQCPNMTLEYWVEPMTGEIVAYGESCPGDVVYNTQTGEVIRNLSRWGGASTGDDLIRQANFVSGERSKLVLTTQLIPVVLAVIGVVALIVGLLPLVMKRAESSTSRVAV